MNTAKPNIVVIMFDHQLYYRHNVLRPCFDKFSEEATFYNNAFSVCPLCGPARRTMLDGLYPHKHGQIDNKLTEITEETYLQSLERAGYDNYYFGKFHAGKGNAQTLGFKGFSPDGYSNPYLLDDYKEYLKERGLKRPRADVEFSETERQYFKEGREVDLDGFPYLYTYTFGTLKTPADTHECFYLANRACEQLERLAKDNGNKPFSLRVDFWGPHHPYFPAPEYLNMYNLDDIEIYGSFGDDLHEKPSVYKYECAEGLSRNNELIYPNPQSEENWKKMLRYAYAQNTMCDAAAGRIIDTLKRLNLFDNTVVIWSADHGDALCSHGGHIDKNCYLTEEVARIPLAVHNPFSHAGTSDAYVSNMDIPATIADFCGQCFENNVDSQSLKNITKDGNCGREYFVVVTFGHFVKHIARAVCWKNYRYIYNKGTVDELYDLNTDPYEMKNLTNTPEYAEVKQKLKGFLDEWRNDYGDREI